MFEASINKLKLVGGVRNERSVQRLFSHSETNQEIKLSPEYNDWLPGINITYQLNDLLNIRGAFSRTYLHVAIRVNKYLKKNDPH